MADDLGNVDGMFPSVEEIQKMKVASLKIKLRELGLPTTGNKTELAERLQEAYLSHKGGDSFDSSQFDESHVSELETTQDNSSLEDNALLESYIDTSEADSKVLHSTLNELTSSKPLKKRNLVRPAVESSGTEKKVLLNRTNVTNTQFNITTVTKTQPENSTDNKNEIKVVTTVKNMSPAERLALRAKRFNTTNTITTGSHKLTNIGNSRPTTLSTVGVTPNLEILKKRAERFGQSVSTVMKQIEEKEKLLKRKYKFGTSVAVSASSNLDESEKKKRRAERFAMS